MKKYTWLIILIAILISFIFPAAGLVFKPYLGYLLMLIMFFSYLNVDLKKILICLKDSRNEFASLGIIHLVSPLLVLLTKPFLSEEIFLGLILVATISSGMSVVFLSHLYGGKPSQALVITTLSNLFSPITIPFLVLLFTRTTIEIDILAMSLTMLKLVIIPFVIALIIRKTRINQPLKSHGDHLSIIILFFLILGIVSPLRTIIFDNINLSLFLAGITSILVIINFSLGYFLGKNKPEKITFGISSSFKNFTLATVTALSLFNPIVALPAIIYTVVNNILLIPIQLIFAREKK